MGSAIHRKLANWLIIAFALMPMAQAISCTDVAPNKLGACNEIASSGLSDSSKQLLITDLLYGNNRIADHDFVRNWNTGIDFSSVPSNVATASNGYIKDAWLKVIAITPSVIADGKLLSPGGGSILSKYNYRFEMPSGLEGWDCKTEYSLVGNDATLNVYLNGEQIGNRELVDFTSSSNMNFEVVLTIQTQVDIKHYQIEKRCCRKSRAGDCLRWCEDCKLYKSESRVNQVTLRDSKSSLLYDKRIKAEVKPLDIYQGTVAGRLNISDFDAFELTFPDSFYKKYRYYYDLNVSIPPYNVLTVRANNLTTIDSNNINVELQNKSYKFYVSNYKDCKLKFHDHFNSWLSLCNLELNRTPISVKVNRFHFKENEAINVTLEPPDTLMMVRYGKKELAVKNSAQFTADPSYNRISVSYGGSEVDQIISVSKKDAWEFALNLGVFSGILYFLYSVIKKFGGLVFS